jgi:hypothetical protein
MAPEIAEEITKLARNRILDGGNLATDKELPARIVKLSLIWCVRSLEPKTRSEMGGFFALPRHQLH